MIKASALLVALAIGLLVAGVVASSLLMVYVSIGVCAVAALLLAVGVFSHWSEIFGRREAPLATPGGWSEPQVNVTAPVLASIQAVAAARGSGRPGREEADVRPDGARSGAGPAAGGRTPEGPAEVVPSLTEPAGRGDEFPAPRRSDDLWDRVEEELGSAAKRDTGALSWPATVFPPVPPEVPEPAESAASTPEGGPQPRAGTSAWLWDPGAGWQPPETVERETAARVPGGPGVGGPGDEAGPLVPGEPAADADVAAGAAGHGEAVPDDAVAPDDAAAPDDEALDAEDHEAPDHEAAGPGEESAPLERVTGESASGEPAGGGSPQRVIAASRPAGEEPAAGTPAEKPAAGTPAEEPAAGTPAAQPPIAQEPAPEEPAPEEPAPEEPAPDEPAPEEPAPEPSAVKEPVAEPPDAGAPAADDVGTDDPGTDDPGADDHLAAAEAAVEEPAAQEPAVEEPAAGTPEHAAEGSPGDGDADGDGAATGPAPGRVEVTVVPGVARYHRRECILIRFLGAGDLEIMTKQEAVDAKFIACRACQPDELED